MPLSITTVSSDLNFIKTLGTTGQIPIDETIMTISILVSMIRPLLDIRGLSDQYKYSSKQIDCKTIGEFSFQKSIAGSNNSVNVKIIEDLKHEYTGLLSNDYWRFIEGEILY